MPPFSHMLSCGGAELIKYRGKFIVTHIYIGYPESKFQWDIKKKTIIYFETIYIAI
jgi:hypothetical protein